MQFKGGGPQEPYKLIDSTFLSTSIASLQAIPSFFIVNKNICILSYWSNFRGWPYNHKNKAISNIKMRVVKNEKKLRCLVKCKKIKSAIDMPANMKKILLWGFYGECVPLLQILWIDCIHNYLVRNHFPKLN